MWILYHNKYEIIHYRWDTVDFVSQQLRDYSLQVGQCALEGGGGGVSRGLERKGFGRLHKHKFGQGR